MEKPDFNTISRALDLKAAIGWLEEDSKDDFFPDALNFRDIGKLAEEYLTQRRHKIFQYDSLQSILDFVPKKNGMLREAIWLHPSHRILYLALLHYFIPKLDSHIPKSVYSYRLDTRNNDDEYPFPKRNERWKDFVNDFRQVCMEPTTGAVLITDLSCFFDHISIDRLVEKIETALGRGANSDSKQAIILLKVLLHSWSSTGFGIPQNLDGSSFFGSFFLNDVDHQLEVRRYRSFRWLDDIRICTQNKKQALRALHELQSLLAHDRLFLASDKTKIVERDSEEFAALLDVADDKLISEAEEAAAESDCAKLRAQSPVLRNRLLHHSEPRGDDRKFRALANRLLTFASFDGMADEIIPIIRQHVLPRLDKHPDRSDYWSKMLIACWDEATLSKTRALVAGPDTSIFSWQRFYMWKLLTCVKPPLPEELLQQAMLAAKNSPSDLVSAQAAVCLGKHGTNRDRVALYDDLYRANTPYPTQRAVIIALQELPAEVRERYWSQALRVNPDHLQLVEYIRSLSSPDYGCRPMPSRHCKPDPRPLIVKSKTGIGLVNGQPVRFRLSRSHYDYE